MGSIYAEILGYVDCHFYWLASACYVLRIPSFFGILWKPLMVDLVPLGAMLTSLIL